MDPPRPKDPDRRNDWTRGELAFAGALFVVAAAALGFAIYSHGALVDNRFGTALFFLVYGLLTISVGYQHPNLGYYSFDRVSQVASILVLGPVDAAWINGVASFLYPWHRLRSGVPLRSVVAAAFNNSALMSLIVLVSGLLYLWLGGEMPLRSLSATTALALVALVLCMQFLNDAGMLALLVVGRRSLAQFFSGFAYALELCAGATAVLVALVFNTMPLAAFALLLFVLAVGMLAMRQFADMRHKLELIVEQRTRTLRETARELERQATRDTLTGLFNRRHAEDFLRKEIESVQRHRRAFTIAIADIDSFKQINDLHSHAMGDAVLRGVADVLQSRCRSTDMLARYGGEEFLICFPHTDLRQARVACEELRAAVASTDWTHLGLSVRVTISFGLAEHRADPSHEVLLNRADLQLYAAKNGGRNLVVA